MKRKEIIKEIGSDSISPYVSQKKNLTFYYEEIFKSLNKFLMDLVTSEVIFFLDFFDMNPSSSSVYLNGIFKSTINTMYENVKNYLIKKCTDFFALSLMIIINIEQTKLMGDSRKLSVLDYYFDQ